MHTKKVTYPTNDVTRFKISKLQKTTKRFKFDSFPPDSVFDWKKYHQRNLKVTLNKQNMSWEKKFVERVRGKRLYLCSNWRRLSRWMGKRGTSEEKEREKQIPRLFSLKFINLNCFIGHKQSIRWRHLSQTKKYSFCSKIIFLGRAKRSRLSPGTSAAI